jgi:ketosteroid isomerase-like protein
MKMRLIITFIGLAISLALPAFAQQKDTVDPQLRQQLEAFDKKVDEAFNNEDAAALAATYTDDAVHVTPGGPIYGREAIEKYFADRFQKWHYSNHISRTDQYSPHIIGTAGNEIWATGEFSQTIPAQNGSPIQLKGYFGSVKVREGDTWKTRMLTFNITPQAAATPSPTASPSSQ